MKSTIFSCLIFSVFFCSAQTEKSSDTKPFIEVTGTATKEVEPDQIFISITLSDKVVNNEKYSIESQEDKLKKSLRKVDIDLANLVLSDATSEITRYKTRETGFKVTKQYTLQVKNSDEVSKVFKELYAINIKESSISSTDHSKIDSLRKEVRITAIKAAKDKAEYLLAAVGEKIDKPLEIREEGQQHTYVSNLSNNFTSQVTSSSDVYSTGIAFQKLTIKFSYYIKYGIK